MRSRNERNVTYGSSSEKLGADSKITPANISKKKELLKGYDIDHKIDVKTRVPCPEKQRKRDARNQESGTKVIVQEVCRMLQLETAI